MVTKQPFLLGEEVLTASVALAIARDKRKLVINATIARKIAASHETVQKIVNDGETVYGINTGFGPLCTTVISASETAKLQFNLLRSHSVGVGDPIPGEASKLMLILKAHSLAMGHSGIHPDTLERILWHIRENVIPVVPEQGSVGASGDLAPLAHLFLPLIGLGKVYYRGSVHETGEILSKEHLAPIKLGPKEGLALINGTQFIAAYAVKVVEKFHNCLETADIIGAMTLEALLGSVKPFDLRLHNLRPFPANQLVAHRLNQLLDGSEMLKSHANCGRVQDPYSLRCMPQVHGASRNAWLHLREILQTELNSVTDNPVILENGDALNGGNFHGQPLALPLDYTAFAASELGNISDRRTYLLLEGGEGGLPALLMENTGINSGFMIPQYTSAALVSENKSLCFPVSADSIPTSLGQEDHVSMGSISGRKTYRILNNLENILAVELLCASQAFDFRRPMKSGKLLEACHEVVRQHIAHADEDRVFGEDIAAARQLIATKQLAATANQFAEKDGTNLNGPHHDLFTVY